MEKSYCHSLTKYQRAKSRVVNIGEVAFGGNNPIRLQSMTTTDTMDTESSVAQAKRMIDAGCELVRYTAPSKKEAENLKEIRAALDADGYTTPIVADIHFTPNAAEIAAQHIEKVRVNPGNYADKKKFEFIEYTNESYQEELDRIREKFTPLVLLCKEKGRAMRIGTNHGSLSDRIMSRYGDNPAGMVESALEFVQICEDNAYYDLVISMKSSNTLVMVQAYRLLAARMRDRDHFYPIHLGVTEAGDGEDGRIKSAVGIGTLLVDGIGDTIRVSLTEEPEFEIPVARKLAERYALQKPHQKIKALDFEPHYNPFEYHKRVSKRLLNIGGGQVPVIISDLSKLEKIKEAHLFAHGYTYNVNDDKWNLKEQAVDYIYTGSSVPDFELPGTLGVICEAEFFSGQNQVYPAFNGHNFIHSNKLSSELNFVRMMADDIDLLNKIKGQLVSVPSVIFLASSNENNVAEMRRFFFELDHLELDTPVILANSYSTTDEESFQLFAGTDLGALLVDGFGDGIGITASNLPQHLVVSTSFGVLQASRTRISRTEYISCPSCGRTLFDLQETTAKIRAKTNHLKGLKIGIMGCIVNGPGEMADADYGYVGVGKGKINLYKEQEVIKRSIPEHEAVKELIALIDEYGDWVEPNG